MRPRPPGSRLKIACGGFLPLVRPAAWDIQRQWVRDGAGESRILSTRHRDRGALDRMRPAPTPGPTEERVCPLWPRSGVRGANVRRSCAALRYGHPHRAAKNALASGGRLAILPGTLGPLNPAGAELAAALDSMIPNCWPSKRRPLSLTPIADEVDETSTGLRQPDDPDPFEGQLCPAEDQRKPLGAGP